MSPRCCWSALLLLTGACGSPAPSEDRSSGKPPEFEPPVAINAEPPISYPPTLFRDRVEGTVVLLLFVDEAGQVVLDSTRIHDGSGYAALDSAVLAGVDDMRFAPARLNGAPVAAWFLQPVHFRQPASTAPGGGR